MEKIKQSLTQFMNGRYGTDELSKFMMVITMILVVVSSFAQEPILYAISLILIIAVYFRMFSKNFDKRYRENQVYMRYYSKIIKTKNKQKKTQELKKVYHYYKCPDCKTKMRVPKGKGKVKVSCPSCGKQFVKKS